MDSSSNPKSQPPRRISQNPPSLANQAHPPLRPKQLDLHLEHMDEKSTPLVDLPDSGRQRGSSPLSAARASPSSRLSPNTPNTAPRHPPFPRQPTLYQSSRARSLTSSTYTRPRGLRIANLIRPWIPIIMYIITSLAFVVAFALYKDELFLREFLFPTR